MRLSILALVLAFAGAPAAAQTVALLIGAEDYEAADDVRDGDAVTGANAALMDVGVRTVVAVDPDFEDLQSALLEFGQMAPQADRILVAISGRFVHSPTETYFLPVDAEGAPLASIAARSLPLSTVTAWLARAPGRAILLLGTDAADESHGEYLRDGLGEIEVPNGVTLVTGAPAPVGSFLRRTLAEPGASIREGAEDYGLEIGGFLGADFDFVDRDQPRDDLRSRRANAREILAWGRARQDDTLEAYRRYLDVYPDGEFSRMAENRIAALDVTPAAQAERAEQSLDLDRAARRAIQRHLSILNYDTRGIDGIFGPGTRSAIGSWQEANGFPQTGFLDRQQIERLSAQAAQRQAELEAEAERRREAQAQEDDAFWRQVQTAGTRGAFVEYLERYPDGRHAADARAEIAEIDARQSDGASRAERQEWRRARSADTIAAYRTYLDLYPRGAFVSEANDRIAALNRAARQEQDSAAAEAERALNLTPLTRQLIEQRLAQLDLDPGRVDGAFDGETRRALRRYQQARNLPVTGYVSEAVVIRLLADSMRQIFD